MPTTPTFCTPFLSKQPTTGYENAMAIPSLRHNVTLLKNPGHAPALPLRKEANDKIFQHKSSCVHCLVLEVPGNGPRSLLELLIDGQEQPNVL